MADLRSLVDTDILSLIMRGDAATVRRAERYLSTHGCFAFSIITRYEILRGLHAKEATAQLAQFEVFCAGNDLLQLMDEVVLRAAEIYGELHRRGELIGDADILIAATALENGLVLATANEAHFSRIGGLRLDNWSAPPATA